MCSKFGDLFLDTGVEPLDPNYEICLRGTGFHVPIAEAFEPGDDGETPIAETRLLAKFAPVVGGELQAPAGRARTICSWETPVRQQGSSRWDDVPQPPPRMG